MIPPSLRPRPPSSRSTRSSWSPQSPPQHEEMMRFLAANRPPYRSLSPPRTQFARPIPWLPLHLIPCIEDRPCPSTSSFQSFEQYQEEKLLYMPPPQDRRETGDEPQTFNVFPRRPTFIEDGPSISDSPVPALEPQGESSEYFAQGGDRVSVLSEDGGPTDFGALHDDRNADEEVEVDQDSGENESAENGDGSNCFDPSKIMITITNIPVPFFENHNKQDHENSYFSPLDDGENTYNSPDRVERGQEPRVQVNEGKDNGPRVPAAFSDTDGSFSSSEGGPPSPVRTLEPYFDESAEIDSREEENIPAPTPECNAHNPFPDAEATVQAHQERSTQNNSPAENMSEKLQTVPIENFEGREEIASQERCDEDGNSPENVAEDERPQGQEQQRTRRRGTKRRKSEVETGYWLRSREPAAKSNKRRSTCAYWLRSSRP